LVIRVKVQTSGQRIGDGFIRKTERVVPYELSRIVLEKRSDIGSLDAPGPFSELRAGSQRVVEIVDGFWQLDSIAGGGAGAGAGVHDQPQGPRARFVLSSKPCVHVPKRSQVVGNKGGSRFADDGRRNEVESRHDLRIDEILDAGARWRRGLEVLDGLPDGRRKTPNP